ncbi:uncharacterized protein VDAG_03266 [Verticillium dahliae VdLs.17]|uniref:Ubiquitin-like domain-containing protein n=1 Tax=Verticillium dahliae (strain VdLs.17 / ATCC MYA-4575 / FGSC 10137) TaxID=498257 RepID=G2WZ24_VERDV|nr:uncharacterized protein VDAG_03266 [Verticillium dahliae VdLs.17]EGY21826.1 hypothetical protein VDAG_03266 [Verticillium dahliae VdLs.17]
MAESTAPKRWLPFKPTALRQNSNPKPETKDKVEHGGDNNDDDDEDDGLSLFKRSKEFFPKVMADEARRRKRKHAHRDKGKELATPAADANDDSDDPGHGARLSNDSYKHTSPSRASRSRPVKRAIDDSDGDLEDHIETPPSKRSRTSDEYIDRNIKTTRSPSHDQPSTPSRHATRSLALRTPKKEGPMPKGKNAVVSLDDSGASDADLYGATPVRDVPGTRSSNGAAIVIDDDDPFAEGEQVKASDDGTSSKKDEVEDDEEEEEEGDDDVEEYIRAARERQKKAEAAQANPAEADQTRITILVTSPIPGAKPVKYLYTLWKPLGKLREVWNSTEGYDVEPPVDAAVTFITWRGRRLYDSTTLNSLQIRAAENGTLRSPAVRNPHDADGFSDGWTRVHMEMWTEALWDEHKRKEDRRRLRDLGELDDYSGDDDDDDDGGGVAVGADPEAKETKIKIILKARTGEPVKTTARPASTVAELIEVYRKMRDVPASTEIQLLFDGEPLDGETTVEDADIEDMDSWEVHLRE